MERFEKLMSEHRCWPDKSLLSPERGRGLGRAFAHTLADAGAAVVVAARSADQVAETAASINANGGLAMAFRLDVSDRQA